VVAEGLTAGWGACWGVFGCAFGRVCVPPRHLLGYHRVSED